MHVVFPRGRLLQSLGLEVSKQQLRAWQEDSGTRAKRSIKRRTEEYTKYRAAAHRNLKLHRNLRRKDPAHTYKEKRRQRAGSIASKHLGTRPQPKYVFIE